MKQGLQEMILLVIFVCAVVWLTGCAPGLESTELTSEAPRRAVTDSAPTELEAQAMKLVEQKCLSCHNQSPGSGGIYGFGDVGYMIAAKYIEPGNPNQSPIFTTLVLSRSSSKAMPPQNYPALQNDEISLIEAWILSMAPVKNPTTTTSIPPGSTTSTTRVPGSTTTTTTIMGTTTTTMEAVVSFKSQVSPFLSSRCTTCHGSAGGVNLSSYANVRSQVLPGNPDNSRLIRAISVGGSMSSYVFGQSANVTLLKLWIQQGALNN